jgi:pyridoxamine 5'-phosphate oxidase family protein
MSDFTDRELEYLNDPDAGRLARIATVGNDGTPHVVPVGWSFNRDFDSIDVGGMNLTRTKKFRDARRGGRAAVVIDDLAGTDPWKPRGIEVRGRAETVEEPRALIRIHPGRIVSWGLESDQIGRRHSRSVSGSSARG